MKYFNNCKSIEDVKKTYRTLCKQYHPDVHPASDFDKYNAIMSEINGEYETAFNRFKNVHETADGKTYTKTTTETPEQFKEIIEKLIHCDGLIIDIVGTWIWLSGNTFEHKETIKAIDGMKYSRTRKMWYWNNDNDSYKKRATNLSYDQIKDLYGCETVQTTGRARIVTT